MYDIKFASARTKRDFKKLIKKISPKLKDKLRDTLTNNPYPSRTHGTTLNKVEKKRNVYCYPLTGGDRILFLIYEEPKKYIEILFSGNDDEEIRFLKRLSE